MGTVRRIFDAQRRTPCFYLLVGLVGLLVIHPFFEESTLIGRGAIAILTLIVLFGAMLATRAEPRKMTIAVALGLATFALLAIDLATDPSFVAVIANSLGVAFFAYVTITVLQHVVRRGPVTADRLFGAASAYLLLGITWAMIYSLIVAVEPVAFRLATDKPIETLNWSQMLYFSYTTLTTLGYGDIVPLTAEARNLAVLESATGVLYLAMLVARLVALYSAQQPRAGRGESKEEHTPD